MALLSADCPTCGYHRHLSMDILRSYVLEDGSKLTIPTTYAWCHGCTEVTAVERLPSLSKIEATISECNDSPEDAKRCQYYKDLKAWRTLRVSPAKCLECGSDHFDPFERFPRADSIIHPGCGGSLRLRIAGTSGSRAWLHYNPEGERLPESDSLIDLN
jgi:hypothetical protein